MVNKLSTLGSAAGFAGVCAAILTGAACGADE
jgi:hypothetical protein